MRRERRGAVVRGSSLMHLPFAPGSISLRLYPHGDLPALRIVEVLREQAAAAAHHGFDGVMTSEHHGGFAGYLPNPLQVAGWLLEARPRPDGRHPARCCCRCARPPSWPRRRRGWPPASRAEWGSVLPPARSPMTSTSWASRCTRGPSGSPTGWTWWLRPSAAGRPAFSPPTRPSVDARTAGAGAERGNGDHRGRAGRVVGASDCFSTR